MHDVGSFALKARENVPEETINIKNDALFSPILHHQPNVYYWEHVPSVIA